MLQAIAEAEHVIRDNRRIKVNEVAAMLDVSQGSAHHTIDDMLQFHKVGA
jgi:Mn-dependent DtxR family transcriptional regulator